MFLKYITLVKYNFKNLGLPNFKNCLENDMKITNILKKNQRDFFNTSIIKFIVYFERQQFSNHILIDFSITYSHSHFLFYLRAMVYIISYVNNI